MPVPIAVENLKFSYPDGTAVLRGLSFSVQEGECIGFIGPNGAGKTTLLLHLNGILKGAEGSVKIYDKEVRDENIKFIRKTVGLVFQDPDTQLFMPTVFDDVAFGPTHMGFSKDRVHERVQKALADVDMAKAKDRISHHLSFGEKKRVSIATVLSMEPDILVLDEPTSNLDPRHRRQLIEILKSIPVTKIIASHDLGMISHLADRVIFMEEGSIVAEGPASKILNDIPLLKRFGFYPTF